MAPAKKVEVEITVSRAIIPQSIHEVVPNKRHVRKLGSLGEVIEVYEDVAKKLETNFQASRVTKDSPATIKDTLEANEEAERQRRASLTAVGKAEGDETPDETWTVAELKEYAAANEVDLGGATTKAEILGAINAK